MRIAAEQLADIRGGLMVEELTASLSEVVNAVIATGKKGAVQLKLDINSASKGDAVVTVADEIKKTVPQEKRTEGAEDEPDNRRPVASNGKRNGLARGRSPKWR